MPERDSTGSRLPEPEPEPEQELDVFSVYNRARRLRAETLRALLSRIFRPRRRLQPVSGSVQTRTAPSTRRESAEHSERKAA